MDNQDTIDLANNFNLGGQAHCVEVRNDFLPEGKDEGLLVMKHIPRDENEADIFTKNTAAPVFNRHIPKFVGLDVFMETEQS
jgi:hypothetical protein